MPSKWRPPLAEALLGIPSAMAFCRLGCRPATSSKGTPVPASMAMGSRIQGKTGALGAAALAASPSIAATVMLVI